MNQCHAAARELDADPAAQAAARACGQGSAVVHAQSHSLGLYFYGAAAVAYDRIGTEVTAEAYDEIAREVCADLTATLQVVAIADEPNPAKIKWYC
ncbi:MAG: putative immunity protein [Anaerovoracaceae bacterium]